MAGVETLGDIFWTTVREHPARPALRWKEGTRWDEISYESMGRRVRDLAHGLLALGLKKGDRVAIWSKNAPGWALSDWAAVTTGLITVPIYDTLTPEKAAYILRDSGARVLFVHGQAHLDKVRTIKKGLPSLRHVIVFEEVFEKNLEPHEHALHSVEADGRAWAAKHPGELEKAQRALKPADLASIVYTSGTTGEPKGAMLTHGNFTSNVVAALDVIPINPGDVALSFLPLSHVFERMAGHFTLVRAAATIAYAESVEKVPDNLAEVRPEVMMSVPRLYEKLYARVQEKVRGDSFLKRWIFKRAVETGKEWVRTKYTLKVNNPGLEKRWKRYDHLVYSKLKARVGGRLRFFVSGGAPLAPEIHEFFTAVGLPILQGYGLTETSPVISANTLDELRVGSAGKTFAGVQVRIADDGEILVKGPNVFQGYWEKPKETKEAFTPDGWFKTGDIGHLDEDGFLFITDRKKELLVMSNGKKVAPQPIENELKTKTGVGVAVLIGNDRPYISALLAPDLEGLKKLAKEKKIRYQDAHELLSHPQIHAVFAEGVEAVNQGLSQYEKIKRFRVLPQEITPQSEEMTPTLKVKRRVVDTKWKDQIEELYRNGSKAG